MRISIALSIACLLGCQSRPVNKSVLDIRQSQPGAQVDAPPMPERKIGPPPTTLPAGQVTQIDDSGVTLTLFVPKGFAPAADGTLTLTVHFHGAVWFVIDEHLRRGLSGPLLCAALGEGSSVYRKPFEDPERFARLIAKVEAEIAKRSPAADSCRVVAVDISSFSAGYGAVREIVKSPEYRKLIRRIVLSDSMYASYESQATSHPSSQPAREHIEPWIAFARAAADGNKTFVLTYSQVPTQNYASSALCAEALCDAIGVPLRPVLKDSSAATSDPDFPLQTRADERGFHAWGYGGSNGQAHMTQARHLADVWLALDQAGMP